MAPKARSKRPTFAPDHAARLPRLTPDVLDDIARHYVDIFNGEPEAEILPALLSFKALSSSIIPHLYHHVHITNNRQPKPLGRAAIKSIQLIRLITIHPCKQAQYGHHLGSPQETCDSNDPDADIDIERGLLRWTLHLGDLSEPARKNPIDEIVCRKVLGPQTERTHGFFHPRKMIYDSLDAGCPQAWVPNTQSAYDPLRYHKFMELVSQHLADSFEVDLSGLIRGALRRACKDRRTPRETQEYRTTFILLTTWLVYLFHPVKGSSWIEGVEGKVELPIVLTCSARPFVFARRVGERSVKRFHTIFELRPGSLGYGPKEEVDEMFEDSVSSQIDGCIEKVGYEWTPARVQQAGTSACPAPGNHLSTKQAGKQRQN